MVRRQKWNCWNPGLSWHEVSVVKTGTHENYRAWVMDCGKCGWSLFCFGKNGPQPPNLCSPDLVVRQQPVTDSEKLRSVNSDCKSNEESRFWEAQDHRLVRPGSLAFFQVLHFFIHRGTFKLDFIQLPLSMGSQNVLVVVQGFFLKLFFRMSWSFLLPQGWCHHSGK